MHAHVELEQNKLPTCEGCSHNNNNNQKFRCSSKKREQGKSSKTNSFALQRERYKELFNTEIEKYINNNKTN